MMPEDKTEYLKCVLENEPFSKTYLLPGVKISITVQEPTKAEMDTLLKVADDVTNMNISKTRKKRKINDCMIVSYVRFFSIGELSIVCPGPVDLSRASDRFSFISESVYNIITEHVKAFKRLLEELQMELIPARNALEEKVLAYYRNKETGTEDNKTVQ